jgi:hypothetical protein
MGLRRGRLNAAAWFRFSRLAKSDKRCCKCSGVKCGVCWNRESQCGPPTGRSTKPSSMAATVWKPDPPSPQPLDKASALYNLEG